MGLSAAENGYENSVASLEQKIQEGVEWVTLDIPMHGFKLGALTSKALALATACQCRFSVTEDPEYENKALRALADVPTNMEQIYIFVGGQPADVLKFLKGFNAMLQEPRGDRS